jgi:hypothetical protein
MNVVRVSSGNFLEMFRFHGLRLLCPSIGRTFFPNENAFASLMLAELWLSFIYGSYNGGMVVMLTEIMPIEVRTTGFSLAYSLATALFGGNTPAICTYLIHITNNKAMPGVWMSAAALVGLVAALLAGGKRVVPNSIQVAQSI